jgi:hypothetical protein
VTDTAVDPFAPEAMELVNAMFATYPEQTELVAQRIRSQKMAARIAELEAAAIAEDEEAVG